MEEYPVIKETAVDLGAGNLRDAKYLLQQGFKRVIAVDRSQLSRDYVVPGVVLETQAIEQYVPDPQSFDLAVSCFTLFFVSSWEVHKVFDRVYQGLRPGGIFACNVLGELDDWVTCGHPVSHFTQSSVQRLRKDFTVLHEKEAKFLAEREAGQSSAKQKYWHQRIMVLRKE